MPLKTGYEVAQEIRIKQKEGVISKDLKLALSSGDNFNRIAN